MFTGLIQSQGTLVDVQQRTEEIKLRCRADAAFLKDVVIGDSICVDGACLTVVAKTPTQFTVDIMPETFRKTTFQALAQGSVVNLERALQVGQRFEGHIVQGHVDATVRLLAKKRQQHALVLTFALPQALIGQVVQKGSVAINGISLTVIQASSHDFQVGVIPHSQEQTNLDRLRIGSTVNLETDIIGKYVQKQLKVGQHGG